MNPDYSMYFTDITQSTILAIELCEHIHINKKPAIKIL